MEPNTKTMEPKNVGFPHKPSVLKLYFSGANAPIFQKTHNHSYFLTQFVAPSA